MTSRIVLAAVIFASVGGVATSHLARTHGRVATGERHLAAPLSVQRSFRHFSDSAGARLLDTLFALGYHGGNSWDEKSGPVRPNIVAETDSGSVADSVSGIYEAVISLDLHHDVNTDVPGSIALRFVNDRTSGHWVLLTTDGLPEDPSEELSIGRLHSLPSEFHEAISATFADRAEAFAYWKSLESGHTPVAQKTDR